MCVHRHWAWQLKHVHSLVKEEKERCVLEPQGKKRWEERHSGEEGCNGIWFPAGPQGPIWAAVWRNVMLKWRHCFQWGAPCDSVTFLVLQLWAALDFCTQRREPLWKLEQELRYWSDPIKAQHMGKVTSRRPEAEAVAPRHRDSSFHTWGLCNIWEIGGLSLQELPVSAGPWLPRELK